MLKTIVKFTNSLNTNANPREIAHAFCIALILGMMPKTNILWYILFVFFLFIRINKASLLVFTALFTLITPIFDGILDSIGYWVLNWGFMQGIYDFLINIPFVAFTKFNNSIVMGALFLGLVLYIPLYFLVKYFIRLWRRKLVSAFRKTKLVVFIKNLSLVNTIKNLFSFKKGGAV